MANWKRLVAAALAAGLVASAATAQAKISRDSTVTGVEILSPTHPVRCDTDEDYGRRGFCESGAL